MKTQIAITLRGNVRDVQKRPKGALWHPRKHFAHSRSMVGFLCFIGTVGLTSGIRAQEPSRASQPKSTIMEGISALIAKVDALRLEFERIGKRDLSESERKKLESLVEDTEKRKIDVEMLKREVEEKSSALKALNDEFSNFKSRLAVINGSVNELAAAPEQFKAFTKISARRQRTEIVAELEANEAGKRIPLSNKRVFVFEQFKDGLPKPIDDIVTDENGVARVPWPARIRDRGPWYRVFRFKGDTENRPCETRTKVRS